MLESAEAACVLALAGTCRVHVAVDRRWPLGEAHEGAVVVVGVVVVVDHRGRDDARRTAVSVVDTGLTVGDDEAVGRPSGREWDGAAIRRGGSLLLTMMGPSTDEAAWCRAALGPWLGGLYTCMHINAVDTRWRWPKAKSSNGAAGSLPRQQHGTQAGRKSGLGWEPSRGAGRPRD